MNTQAQRNIDVGSSEWRIGMGIYPDISDSKAYRKNEENKEKEEKIDAALL